MLTWLLTAWLLETLLKLAPGTQKDEMRSSLNRRARKKHRGMVHRAKSLLYLLSPAPNVLQKLQLSYRHPHRDRELGWSQFSLLLLYFSLLRCPFFRNKCKDGALPQLSVVHCHNCTAHKTTARKSRSQVRGPAGLQNEDRLFSGGAALQCCPRGAKLHSTY